MPASFTQYFKFAYGWTIGEDPGAEPLDRITKILDDALPKFFVVDRDRTAGRRLQLLSTVVPNGRGVRIVSAPAIDLPANAISYVYFDSIDGTVKSHTRSEGFVGGQQPLYEVETSGFEIVRCTDRRIFGLDPSSTRSFNGRYGDVTPTVGDYSTSLITLSALPFGYPQQINTLDGLLSEIAARIKQAGSVKSVHNRVGDVTAVFGDYDASKISLAPVTGMPGVANVQDAVQALAVTTVNMQTDINALKSACAVAFSSAFTAKEQYAVLEQQPLLQSGEIARYNESGDHCWRFLREGVYEIILSIDGDQGEGSGLTELQLKHLKAGNSWVGIDDGTSIDFAREGSLTSSGTFTMIGLINVAVGDKIRCIYKSGSTGEVRGTVKRIGTFLSGNAAIVIANENVNEYSIDPSETFPDTRSYQLLSYNGQGAVRWELAPGAPSFMSISGQKLICNYPSKGAWSVDLIVRDSLDRSANKTLTIVHNGYSSKPVILTSDLDFHESVYTANVNASFVAAFNLDATGGRMPYEWRKVSQSPSDPEFTITPSGQCVASFSRGTVGDAKTIQLVAACIDGNGRETQKTIPVTMGTTLNPNSGSGSTATTAATTTTNPGGYTAAVTPLSSTVSTRADQTFTYSFGDPNLAKIDVKLGGSTLLQSTTLSPKQFVLTANMIDQFAQDTAQTLSLRCYKSDGSLIGSANFSVTRGYSIGTTSTAEPASRQLTSVSIPQRATYCPTTDGKTVMLTGTYQINASLSGVPTYVTHTFKFTNITKGLSASFNLTPNNSTSFSYALVSGTYDGAFYENSGLVSYAGQFYRQVVMDRPTISWSRTGVRINADALLSIWAINVDLDGQQVYSGPPKAANGQWGSYNYSVPDSQSGSFAVTLFNSDMTTIERISGSFSVVATTTTTTTQAPDTVKGTVFVALTDGVSASVTGKYNGVTKTVNLIPGTQTNVDLDNSTPFTFTYSKSSGYAVTQVTMNNQHYSDTGSLSGTISALNPVNIAIFASLPTTTTTTTTLGTIATTAATTTTSPWGGGGVDTTVRTVDPWDMTAGDGSGNTIV